MEAEPAIEDAAIDIPVMAAPMAAPAPKEPMPVEPILAPEMMPATIEGSLSTSRKSVRATISKMLSSWSLIISLICCWQFVMILLPTPTSRTIVIRETPMPKPF